MKYLEKLKEVLTEAEVQEITSAFSKSVEDATATRVLEESKKLEVKFEEEYKNKLNEAIEAEKAKNEAELAEKMKVLEESTTETLDGFLSSEVEQNIKPELLNSIAINEMCQPIVEGIQKLFVEHWVALDVEGTGLVKTLKEENESLTSQLTESMEKSINLNKELDSVKKDALISEKVSSLTEGEISRVKSLFEDKDLGYTESHIDSFIQLITESVKNESKKDADGNLINENHDLISNKDKVPETKVVKTEQKTKSAAELAGEIL